jgi:signal transduction histidine kinase
MFEIARVMMLIQIPIIISIFVMGLQAISIITEHKSSFKLILAGWFGNLLYICFRYNSGSYTEPVIVIEAFSIMADLFSAYCFYLAAAIYFNEKLPFSHIRNSIIAAIFIGAGTFKLYTVESPINVLSILNLGNLFTALCDFFALLVLTLLFNDLTKRYPGSKILLIGTLIYSIVQLFDLFTYNMELDYLAIKYVNDIGFVLGFICKFLILIGFSILTVQTVKLSSKLEATLEAANTYGENMRTILGRTFHEVNPPLLDIENSLSILSSDTLREDGIFYNKRAGKEIDKIEQALNRAKSILSASVKIYLSEEARVTEFIDHSSDLPFQIEEKRDTYNLNTLIEIAIINFKSKILAEYGTNNFENNHVKFHKQYGKHCNLYCNSVQIVQIYYNLFKNSLEAISGHDRTCNIYIKTKIEKTNPEKHNKTDAPSDFTSSRRIRVEIRDDGPGIDKEILPRIFELGFSTKDTKDMIKGYGLDIVKTFTESNNGTVEVESSNITEGNNKPGTTFIFQFEVN